MPYSIQKNGNQFCVVNQQTGKNVKCHPSRKKALAHMRALYANVPDAGKETVMNIERKSYPISGLKADDQTGTIEAIVSVFNNVDSGKEIVRQGFFTKSIERKLPKGVWAHDWKQPIAKTLEAKEIPPGDPMLPESLKALGGTYIKGQFNLDTQRGKEAYSDIKFGIVDEFSIGYKVTKEGKDEKTGARELLEGDWKEWSPVLVGMNDQTRLLSIKSESEPKEQKSILDDVIEEREESMYFICDALTSAVYRAQMLDEMSEDVGDGSFDLEAALRDIGASLTERLVEAFASPEEEGEEDGSQVVNPAEQADENAQTAMLSGKPLSFKGDLRAGSTFANTTKTVLAAVEVFADRGVVLSEFVKEYKERSKGIMETRFKDGRMYSASNTAHMQRIHSAMGKAKRNLAQIHVDMGDLLAKATKTTEKSSDESLRTQSLRLRSNAIEVLS